jgi:hypothetical protein
MVAFNGFYAFPEALAEGVHDFSVNQLKVALTNQANPPVAANSVLADLTEISYAGLSSRNITTVSSSQTGGLYKLVLADLVLSSTSVLGPFRYIVLYNDTAALKNLIGWYDYGTNLTLYINQTFTIDFSATAGGIQVKLAT